MPSGSYKQVLVGCPFYKWDDGKRRIVCEGLVDNSSIALVYRNRHDYSIQLETFCCQHWNWCEIHRLLMDKYEDMPVIPKERRMRGKAKPRQKRFQAEQLNLFDMLEV